MQTITSNKLKSLRKETLNGVTYLVSNVRMLREGVLNGSRGALFYPIEEISDSVSAWNSMPIVVDHPKRGEKFISARDPKVLNKVGVGFVFNCRQTADSLDGEAWIDLEKLREVDPELARQVEVGEAVEVSTGLQTDNFDESGVFNGKNYTQVAKNYRPDHLALLPGEQGACSIDDGCGLNVNKRFEFVVNCSGSKKSCSCGCKGTSMGIDFHPTSNTTFDFVTNEDGVWRTVDGGAKVFIKDGQVRAGGPKGQVVGGGKGSSSGGSVTKGKGYDGLDKKTFTTKELAQGAVAKWLKTEEGIQASKNKKDLIKSYKSLIDQAVNDGKTSEIEEYEKTLSDIELTPTTEFANSSKAASPQKTRPNPKPTTKPKTPPKKSAVGKDQKYSSEAKELGMTVKQYKEYFFL